MTSSYIIGICYGGYDPSACLLKNGQLAAYMEEERFVRVKHARGRFPINSIAFCMRFANVKWPDIDFISVWWDADKYPEAMAREFQSINQRFGHAIDERTIQWEADCLDRFQRINMVEDISSKLRNAFGEIEIPEIDFVRHHLSHAMTAFHYSGFNSASILTIDGSGEENSTVMWMGNCNAITEIKAINIPNSLGWFYSGLTEYLGFTPYNGEGKVMGMAPYGKFNETIAQALNEIISFDGIGGYTIDPTYLFYGQHSYGERFTDKLVQSLQMLPRRKGDPIEQYVDISFHVQQKLEEVAKSLVDYTVRETSFSDVCLAGGVAYNCKMNGCIRESAGVKNLFVFPISGDNGAVIGAALMTYQKYFGRPVRTKLEHVYYGIEFTDDEIKHYLDSEKIRYEYHDDIGGVAGELLSKGKVIGWFQGRQEGGPRALGNRSILADPRDLKSRDKVNITVKNREPWRPFAPSMLDDAIDEYLEQPVESPFMILSFKVKAEKHKEIPAVVHVDGSTRPHTVRKELNLLFWSLIKSFEDITSVPVILNTSFNKRGEPVVCTPEDAYKDFITSEMDALAIGHYLISK